MLVPLACHTRLTSISQPLRWNTACKVYENYKIFVGKKSRHKINLYVGKPTEKKQLSISPTLISQSLLNVMFSFICNLFVVALYDHYVSYSVMIYSCANYFTLHSLYSILLIIAPLGPHLRIMYATNVIAF